MTDRVTKRAHELLASKVKAEAKVFDATVGWGNDTLWMAQRVGPQGRVWGVDCQEKALAHTRARLAELGRGAGVELWRGEHQEIEQWVKGPPLLSLDAAILNLGYLPGADESICTQLSQTKTLLAWLFPRFAKGAKMVCCVYPGHDRGRLEAQWIEAFADQVPPPFGQSWLHKVANRGPRCPWIWSLDRSTRVGPSFDWVTLMGSLEVS